MKIIKVSEVLPELDASIKRKNTERKQILDIRNSMNRVIDLDHSLTGKTGEAVKEHFTILHIPAILLINQFLDEYEKQLTDIRSLISSYENDNGLVRQDFIEHDVKQGLDQLERLTEDIIEEINSDFSKVSDIVSSSALTIAPIHYPLEQARLHNKSTMEKLNELDHQSVNGLKSSQDQLQNISSFIGKIKGWSKGGIVLSESTVKEIDRFLAENDVINKLIDSATELSVEQGDSTLGGNVADWLDKIGKLNGGMEALKGTVTATILLSNRIVLTRDGKGNFIVKAHPDWIKGRNGMYVSKLADTIHEILKKGSASTITSIQNYFSKFQNAPSRMLRHLVGLNPGTNVLSNLKLLQGQHPYLKFSASQAEKYKRAAVDARATVAQLADAKSVQTIARKIPYVGIIFSLGTNAGEFMSDQNKYKSEWEKGGRAAAGIGMDIGVAGLTAGGAAIGTMIFPGPGTLIGGAVGATIGIVASIKLEDNIKDVGEKAGKWAGETYKEASKAAKDVADDIKDKVTDARDFVSGLFN
ncbi:T7SS effector LXG polymorphic toxin [Bacillus sp. CECT 9360]|uniref:T7SS effector LXG polymorphic toxin n=1 Tax=Bacillus sp. CECT 9360 TaxID=2845821 RepID=UPI001E2DB95C|nr:T7SS effector LXG polymorphic toxin [Bacillus sp. CECT 9360]CAH0345444.1 hypothetical protein BCI9360_01730 [Bacillus sp. CECT 9360]